MSRQDRSRLSSSPASSASSNSPRRFVVGVAVYVVYLAPANGLDWWYTVPAPWRLVAGRPPDPVDRTATPSRHFAAAACSSAASLGHGHWSSPPSPSSLSSPRSATAIRASGSAPGTSPASSSSPASASASLRSCARGPRAAPSSAALLSSAAASRPRH